MCARGGRRKCWRPDSKNAPKHSVTTSRSPAMDRFAGYHSATVAELPEATAVMDPFHVVQLAGEKVTTCRQRLQQATTGHRGRKDNALYKVCKTLFTRRSLLTERQHLKVADLWQEHTNHVGLQ